MQGGVVRVQGDEFWHMTKVLRLGMDDRYPLLLSNLTFVAQNMLVSLAIGQLRLFYSIL